MTGLDYGIVVGFLSVLACGGFAISRLIRDSDDIFVAGRELTPFILGATITATNLSMLHFVGMGGTATQNGLSIVWQNWTGDMALVLSGILVVPVMRRLRIRSIPEFLEMRYSAGLRVLIGAFWGIRLCVYLGILLYVAGSTAIIITGTEPTKLNYVYWLMAFSLVSVLYSAIGGAWAVAMMDSVQFLVMLAGALIVLPIAMHAVGGAPALLKYLHEMKQPHYMQLVPRDGEFNWMFIIAIMLLGFKWSTVDQAILQRAFGANSPRVAAKGMVLAGIITTPIAMFWLMPGLAAAKLHPQGFANPDQAVPFLLSTVLPAAGKGLLGIVLCGLVAAQVSVITADVNSVATLFTSDVYRKLRARAPSQRELLFVVRLSSLACGAVMLVVAYLLNESAAGAVRANLVVVGILDMPLFVVTVLYGLLWKRANWQGATAGFVLGGLVGTSAYLLVPKYEPEWKLMIRNLVPIISSATALIVTPIVSLMTEPPHHTTNDWRGVNREEEEFTVVPKTSIGKLGVGLVIIGFVVFFVGVFLGAAAMAGASALSVAGMIMVFVGGVVRVYTD